MSLHAQTTVLCGMDPVGHGRPRDRFVAVDDNGVMFIVHVYIYVEYSYDNFVKLSWQST